MLSAGAGAGPKGKGKVEPKGKGSIEASIKDTVEPKAKTWTVDEAKTILTGRWESQHDGRDISVEYKADGTFSFNVGKDGKPINGKWMVASVEAVGTPMGRLTILHTEWTIDGSPAIKEAILFRSDNTAQHLHLDQELQGKKVRSDFTKKK